jgi:hypothetical protein
VQLRPPGTVTSDKSRSCGVGNSKSLENPKNGEHLKWEHSQTINIKNGNQMKWEYPGYQNLKNGNRMNLGHKKSRNLKK